MGRETCAQDTPLVGRDHELAELRSAMLAAFDGPGSVYLISGEPGIGKTRLATATAAVAENAGVRVLWGRCWESGGAPPFWPWTQVLREYAEAAGLDAVRSQVGPSVRHLAAVLPELEAQERANPAGTIDDARFALFDAVVRLLRRASADDGLLVVLDDLHAADLASLLLLKFVAHQTPSLRLCVIGTYREVEARQEPGVPELLTDASRAGHTVPLRGLDQAAVAGLIAATGTQPSPSLTAAVHDATSGNPFFVDEVLRLLRAEGQLGADRIGSGALTVPAAVQEALERRFALLPPAARRTLEAAAVFGREFLLSLLGQMTGDDAARLRDHLGAARALGIVRETETANRYAFVHALMRETLYQSVPANRAATLHAAAVSALSTSGAAEARAATIAHHALHAVDALGVARCLELLTNAADRAMETLGYEHAAALYQQGIDLVTEHLPDAPPAQLLLRLAEARSAGGHIELARESCTECVRLARATGDGETVARAALIYGEPGLQGGLVNEQLVGMLEEALDLLPDGDTPLRCRLLARLGLELYFSDEVERRERLSREALDMSSRLGDPHARAAAVRARFMASWAPDNPEERLALAAELKELAKRARDIQVTLHAMARRITCLLELGRVTELDAEIEAHRTLAEQLGQPFHLWTSKTILAMRALLEGRFDDTERLATEAYQLGWERMQQPNAIFAYFNQTISMAFEQGRVEEQIETLQGLADSFPRLRALRSLLAVALYESGRRTEAEDTYAQVSAAFPEWPRDSNWLHAAGWFAEVVWRLRDRTMAVRVYNALSPYAGRIEMAGMPHPVSFWGSASRPLGLMATVLGRWDDAERHFRAALEEHRLLGARPYTAHVQAEYAQMLLERSDPGDAEHAATLLDRATAAARSMGMQLLAAQAEATRARQVDGPHVQRAAARAVEAPQGAPDAVLRREGDVWALHYTGGEFRVKATRGMAHLAYLVARPGQEVLALNLVARDAHSAHPPRDLDPDVLPTRGPLDGGLGAALDPQAKRAYQRRLEELREEVSEAEIWGDAERAAKAQEEIDALAHELAGALGLGGRDRKTGSAGERARIAATKAIRGAIRKIAEVDPVVGRYLNATIRTGTFCAYEPDPGNSLLAGLGVVP